MTTIPIYLSVGFMLCVCYSLFILFSSTKFSWSIVLMIFCWIVAQGLLAWSGFYHDTETIPPRLVFVLGPLIISFIAVFNSKKGKLFLDQLNFKVLMWVHLVRLPIELILYGLFVHKALPEIMTFSGRNLDIVAAFIPFFIFFFGHDKKGLPRKKFLILVNSLGLVLLINIIFIAIFSTPYPFQLYGLEQPNLVVLNFPFVWLPSVVVPVVLLMHMASIRNLLKTK